MLEEHLYERSEGTQRSILPQFGLIRVTKINLNQLGNLEYHVLYNYLYYIWFGT